MSPSLIPAYAITNQGLICTASQRVAFMKWETQLGTHEQQSFPFNIISLCIGISMVFSVLQSFVCFFKITLFEKYHVIAFKLSVHMSLQTIVNVLNNPLINCLLKSYTRQATASECLGFLFIFQQLFSTIKDTVISIKEIINQIGLIYTTLILSSNHC